jgi:hypothetical protein
MPAVVVHLGALVGLMYRPPSAGGPTRTFIHFMDDPPLLTSNHEGSQLYIVGGSYQVSASGIKG